MALAIFPGSEASGDDPLSLVGGYRCLLVVCSALVVLSRYGHEWWLCSYCCSAPLFILQSELDFSRLRPVYDHGFTRWIEIRISCGQSGFFPACPARSRKGIEISRLVIGQANAYCGTWSKYLQRYISNYIWTLTPIMHGRCQQQICCYNKQSCVFLR